MAMKSPLWMSRLSGCRAWIVWLAELVDALEVAHGEQRGRLFACSDSGRGHEAALPVIAAVLLVAEGDDRVDLDCSPGGHEGGDH